MSNSLNQEVGDIVFQVITDGAAPPVITTSQGVNAQTATPAGVVRNGKGDYTINHPNQPCDILSCSVQITATAAAAIVQRNGGTDTAKGVLTFDATGAALDTGFDALCIRTKTP